MDETRSMFLNFKLIKNLNVSLKTLKLRGKSTENISRYWQWCLVKRGMNKENTAFIQNGFFISEE